MSKLLQAAKNGDIKALEVLMNKAFGPKGVLVHVTNTGSIIKIVLINPSQGMELEQKLANLIKTGIGKINPKGFEKVFVTAKNTNLNKTVWSTQWKLATSHTKPRVEVTTPQITEPSPKVQVLTKGKTFTTQRYQLFGASVGVTLLATCGSLLFNLSRKASVNIADATSQVSPVEVQEAVAKEQSTETETGTEAKAVSQQASASSDTPYEDAINQALAAVAKSETAANHRDWEEAATAWYQAIYLMQLVPKSNKNYENAQTKANEYQRNLAYAQGQQIKFAPNIGTSKTEIQTTFSQLGVDFSFIDSPLGDGTPRTLGTSPDNLAMIELYGPTDKLTKATMMTFIGQGVSIDLLANYNVGFLNAIVPGYAWDSELADSVNALLNGESAKEQMQAGDNIVSMTLGEMSGVFMFFVSVEPK